MLTNNNSEQETGTERTGACMLHPARWSVSDLAAGNVDEQQQQQEKQDKGTERTGEFFSLVRYPASDLAAEDVNHHQQEH